MKITAEQAPALNDQRQSFLADGMLVVLFLGFANFLLHVYFNNQYGYFRDEFDYMACGDHLAWGYVDHPPLVPFLMKISRLVFGDSLRSIRIIPALATSAAVILTALIARELGGRRFAMVLSALAFIAVPMYLNDGSVMTTNCLEPLLWMGCVYFAILAIKRDDPRYWLWFGVVAGIGLEEKYSIAVLGISIVVGLFLTEHRRFFTRKWIWLGGALAFLVFVPNLLWNVQNHWPFVQLMHNIKAEGRDVVLSPAAFFRPTGSHRSPDPRTHLDHRCARLSIFGAAETLPVPRLVLFGNLYRIRHSQGQELLSRANLSSLPGSRSGGDRELSSHDRVKSG